MNKVAALFELVKTQSWAAILSKVQSILFDRYSSEHREAVPIQKPKTEGLPRAIKTISAQQERGFSAKNYLIAAIVCAAIAGALFAFCLPASIVFMTIFDCIHDYFWLVFLVSPGYSAQSCC